jgi:hypothetical protein
MATVTLRAMLMDMTRECPGTTLQDRVAWLKETLRDTRNVVHDVQNLLLRHKDAGEEWIWIDDMLKVLKAGTEMTFTGGDKYRSLTMVDQRTETDCMRACIATLTGISYLDCPDIVNKPNWREALVVWARQHRGNFVIRHSKIHWPLNRNCDGFIAIGNSPRRGDKDPNLFHAVIVDRWGDMIFDPHYSRRGIEGPILEVWQWAVDARHTKANSA